jgi:hypothetical protein
MTFGDQLKELVPTARSLFKEALGWRSTLRPGDWRQTFHKGTLPFTLLEKPDDLEALMTSLDRLAAPSPPCMILRPDRGADNMLPLVQFRYDNSEGHEKTALRVGFLLRLDRPGINYGFFGFRYESPERGQSHNFYHVQPIRGFEKNDAVQLYAVGWMPTRFPTIAVPAVDLLDLFLVMLLSVQGKTAIQSLAFSSAVSSNIKAKARLILKS